jgi:chemotaxis protein methyltransferase CheR
VSKEFLLTDSEFTHIVDLVYKACGIVLGEHKREMVYSRLARRIRSLKLSSFEQYLDYLESNKDEEFSHFINAITTNLTSFFREMHHFEYLKNTLVSKLIKENRATKRVRIWSAGCSTGEEPYSIAMTLSGMFPIGWDVKILATDLDSNVLEKASSGEYSARSTTGLEPEILKKWFFKDKQGENYKVKPELKKMIHFKRLNLLQKWPMKGSFDLIFCRNVVIYFDKETKEELFNNYANILMSQGNLFLGHSESMGKDQKNFKGLGKTMYQKIK